MAVERFILMIMDEGYPTFYTTPNKTTFEEIEAASNTSRPDENIMKRMFEDGLESEFEKLESDDLVGIQILGMIHAEAF